jgi:DNA-binding beta-propeller fold protein YncE
LRVRSRAAGEIRRLVPILAAVLALLPASAIVAQGSGPYKVLLTKTIGGDGGFDYVYADVNARRLYVPRSGESGAVNVLDLDTLATVGSIPKTSAHGAVVDEKTHHGFASSKPVTMWDSKSLGFIKTIDVQGGPDGITADSFNDRIYIMSHSAPNATVIDAKDGSVVGTIDLGGAPEESASDGNGHLYVNIEDKANIAVVDTKTLTVTAHYDLGGKGGTCAGLALDRKNGILFTACRNPQTIVVLNAADGRILATFPIGSGNDDAAFNPRTMEAYSSQADGTLAIVKEESPTTFSLEQTVRTKAGAKTLTLDPKTDRVLLITADFTPPPAAAPGERPGRPQMVPGTFSILVVGK